MTKKITCFGIVQGVGFRPTAQRIANDLGVRGQVKNLGGNTEVIITGNTEALDIFIRRLVSIFEIRSYDVETLEDIDFNTFAIVHSKNDKKTSFITPDLATCSDCERELFDKRNRRYMHPFISCVNCGPRYSIMRSLPYDRENTTMDKFPLCSECENEYTSPKDRRCHAQTIACNDCGPKLSMSIDDAVKELENGNILAIKDIGGYHLACRCDNEDTVKRLRQIKGREKKPFAVMFRNLDEIMDYCLVNEKEKELLTSPARPIVLLEKVKDLADGVCSDSDFIGAFLPCNPIQLMLLDRCSPLVMTSANLSGELIITDDEEIKKFNVPVLSHNREILTPLDDSVLQVVSGRVQFIRRARGYTPLAIDIGKAARLDTLALGGDLKSTFAFHRGNYVFLSQQLGDLESVGICEGYKNCIVNFKSLHSFSADKIICDMHPGYYSSRLYDADVKIQHHKAHIASVIAEHKLTGEVLGFAFDGTGYGEDGAIKGSEVIYFDGTDFKNLEHLDYVEMLASDEVSRNADLCLSCYLGGNELVDKAIKNHINTVKSSSMGRLFDSVAALLDICHYNDYEGQCAIALERAARHSESFCELTPTLNPIDILTQIKSRLATCDATREELALGFHMMLSKLVLSIAKKYNIRQIALSGGVFNNRILTSECIRLLEENGFTVYINNMVPSGDGGIALGQIYINEE